MWCANLNKNITHFQINIRRYKVTIITAVITSFIIVFIGALLTIQQSLERLKQVEISSWEDPRTLEYTERVRDNMRRILSTPSALSSDYRPFKISSDAFKIVPHLKLSYCVNPKVMSTVLTNSMCYLYNRERFLASKTDIATGWWTNRTCENLNEPWTYNDLKNRLGNDHTNLAVVREPLDRFVSGYINKCVEEPFITYKECFDCINGDIYCVLEKLKKLLKKAPVDGYPDTNPYNYELAHFAPQTWVCHLRNVFKQTYFVKYSSEDGKQHMVDELSSILHRVNTRYEDIQYIRNAMSSTKKTWHSTTTIPQKELLFQVIKSNRTLFNELIDIYKYDFEAFEFNVPEIKSW